MLETLQTLFEVEMSLHGWLALALTVVGVIGLHLGLMHLARKPHEEYIRPTDFWRWDEDLPDGK